VRTSPRLPKGRLPAKVRATQAKGAQAVAAAVAAAAMEVATASKPPNKRMILRRWMLQTRRHVRTLGVFKIACTFM
jgi:uncharacterized protein YmfQ (DUF2313 family)